ncbi:hypothetical protein PPERSA_02593 [Pseudocohnilembus persalinus]|uniref:Calmodulin n=1 Tax=Pseudocohnilembus persalinus TaxID=266149 RepID=A0A0V0R5H3_PSEPJ|nr:hypothetical protein PPERSA_02593 [Pseudocohnilembus persalinus]|eukprot:KRX09721.1 hypothetical protein PPERSA_02593 [Pseudocohnilembus persalinus]
MAKNAGKLTEDLAVFTEEMSNQIIEVFNKYQIDQDETEMDKKKMRGVQLEEALAELNVQLTQTELKELLAESTNAQNEVEFSEFIGIAQRFVKDLFSKEELIESFKVFDPNETGQISKQEFRYIMINYGLQLSPEDAEEICKEADMKNNGQIEYQEFIDMIANPDYKKPKKVSAKKGKK